MKTRLMLTGSAVASSLCLCGTAPAMAVQTPADVTVRCGDVAGLITAVAQTNANPWGGTVKLAPYCAYRFEDDYQNSGNALPAITGKVTIVGEYSTLIRSSYHGANLFRLLSVNEGGELTLKGVTVTGGDTPGDGGGIANEGRLQLEYSTVAGNQSGGDGGGISNEGGTVNLYDSHILTNVVTNPTPDEAGDGGGLSNNATGTLTLKKTTVRGNTADEDGGGIQNQGTLIVERSHIENNEARDDDGGAINNLGNATIKESEIKDNWAGIEGGGINNGEDGTLNTYNTSFEGNRAGRDGGAINNEGTATLKESEVEWNQAGRNGGGINNEQEAEADRTRLTLEYSTVSENRAAGVGGGINNWTGAEVTLKRSRVIRNLPTNCAGIVPGCS
ncbi:hypothetical protein AB0395_00745 [Streptosporangium sp. NPDC051023]|uniref:hypothetical protein n=1 Tax=Streptosporangium sp. NPDC051023 TaxID=3155410 RepID=UPI00344FDAC0